MPLTFDYLNLRRMPINYASPPLCDAEFSSTSQPTIMLEPWRAKRAPSGLRGEFTGDLHFWWDYYPGALCYSLYRAIDSLDPYSEYILVAECTEDSDIVLPIVDPATECGWFVVTAITPEGETEFSEPFFVDCSQPLNAPTTTVLALTLGTNPSIFGASLEFTATVVGASPTGTITFFEGVTNLGTFLVDALFKATLPTNLLTVGVHLLYAEYSGDVFNAPSTSNSLAHTVNVAPGGGGGDCDPDPGEELGAVPTSFGLVENSYVVDIPIPYPHIDFNVPYVYTHADIPDAFPAGDGWQIEVTRASGSWSANDGSPIYSMFGIEAFVNGSAHGFRLAECDATDHIFATAVAAADASDYSFQEPVFLEAGDTFGLGIDLRNVSWGDGQLGFAAPPDHPYYDPTQVCALGGHQVFTGSVSSTIACNLEMNVRVWRDITPSILTAKVKDYNGIKLVLPDPPEYLAGPGGPETYKFETTTGVEWSGEFLCGDGGADYYELEPDDCDGVPEEGNLLINGYILSSGGLWIRWQDSYYDATGTLIPSPAWLLMFFAQDVNWGAEFVWWAGVKLTGTNPLGTYLVWPRDPYNFNAGRPWPSQDQTELFAASVPCIKIVSLVDPD